MNSKDKIEKIEYMRHRIKESEARINIKTEEIHTEQATIAMTVASMAALEDFQRSPAKELKNTGTGDTPGVMK